MIDKGQITRPFSRYRIRLALSTLSK